MVECYQLDSNLHRRPDKQNCYKHRQPQSENCYQRHYSPVHHRIELAFLVTIATVTVAVAVEERIEVAVGDTERKD